MKQKAARSIIVRPESHRDIRAQAEALLRRSGAVGQFPTPIDLLVRTAGVKELRNVEDARKSFLQAAATRIGSAFRSAWNKIQGFAYLHDRTTYVAPEAAQVQKRWIRLHELGHQELPWQRVVLGHHDDVYSLSPACEEQFDQEANDFASELLFQNDRFPAAARSAGASMESIFKIAGRYGASRHATARRFAQEAREPALLITYFESQYTAGNDGQPELILGRAHSASDRFLERYSELLLPRCLDGDDPWAVARGASLVHFGERTFDCGDGTTAKFNWEAWWNTHRLLVLLWKPQGLRLLRLPRY